MVPPWLPAACAERDAAYRGEADGHAADAKRDAET